MASVAQHCRDAILAGEDPSRVARVTDTSTGLTYETTFGELAEWAFVADTMDREVTALMKKELGED